MQEIVKYLVVFDDECQYRTKHSNTSNDILDAHCQLETIVNGL